jgi:hypothetical protein
MAAMPQVEYRIPVRSGRWREVRVVLEEKMIA